MRRKKKLKKEREKVTRKKKMEHNICCFSQEGNCRVVWEKGLKMLQFSFCLIVFLSQSESESECLKQK